MTHIVSLIHSDTYGFKERVGATVGNIVIMLLSSQYQAVMVSNILLSILICDGIPDFNICHVLPHVLCEEQRLRKLKKPREK